MNDNHQPELTPLEKPPRAVYTHQPPKPRKRKNEGLRSIISTILLIILAPVLAILLTTYVFQSYQVDGPSMETALQDRDRLVVLKTPRTVARITGNQYVPNRGEIIVFSYSGSSPNGAIQSGRQLIKRVIGLPGDRVVVSDGNVTVYNDQYPRGFSPDQDMDYRSVTGETAGNVDLTIDEDELFLLGDNRPNSMDSRHFGPVNTDQVVGKLGLRVYPFGEARVN